MKILIIGGSGFLGKYLIQQGIKKSHDITVFDINDPEISEINFRKGDILNKNELNKAIKGMDIVYNMAAMSDIEDCIKNPTECIKYNVLGNTYILDACVQNNIKRYVYASSVYSGGNHGGFYAISKKTSEDIIKQYNKYYNLEYTILRYGTLFGTGAPQTNSIQKFLTDALNNKVINYRGDGNETREYIHVEDASILSYQILADWYKNQTISLTGESRIKVKDLLLMVNEIVGNVEIKYNTRIDKTDMGHYKISPYSFKRENIIKLSKTQNRDLGDSLIEILENISYDKS